MISTILKFSSVSVEDQHDIKQLLLLGYGVMMTEDFSYVQSDESASSSTNKDTSSLLLLLDEEALYLLQTQQITVVDFLTHNQFDIQSLYQLFHQKRSNNSFPNSSSSNSPAVSSAFDAHYSVYSYFKQRK
jgi:hypothetical protein